GVVEDVIDIMLNLKSVVVKTDSIEPQHLRLDATTAGPVLAGDIELPAGVKIVNPDCVICTLSQGGSIHADITVEVGKGYVSVDVLKEQKNGLPIDLLPIDAVFMPIKRVSYNVEPARVGESLDFDKLTIEIWSNGSIEVTQALSKAANLLIEHFSQIAGITGTPVTVKQEVSEIDEIVEEQTPSLTIEDLELSVRAYNCLKRASINSMSELLKKSEHDLLNIKNFGKKSSDEVIEKLHQMGLDLQPNPEGVDDLELI
ncbi:MAG: DNA-directed RNA polymerase subunit alpha, partial [Candidatus Gastranaerophilales bacterium]|nr:DNA-directed RNA polymerase subunit alpha [Candidatus Gastranaerophilales bacterium]